MGRKPIHLIESDERTKVTPISGLFIDLGLPPRKVREAVRVGDVITYGVGFEKYGKGMAVSRAFDDKAGVYVITRVVEELKRADGSAIIFVLLPFRKKLDLEGQIRPLLASNLMSPSLSM